MQIFSLYCNSLLYEHRSKQKVKVLLHAAAKCHCITELIPYPVYMIEKLPVIGFDQIKGMSTSNNIISVLKGMRVKH